MTSDIKRGGRPLALAIVAGGIALTVGLAAGAQEQQRATRGAAFGPGAPFARMCELMDARQAGMLAFAEVRLGITEAEHPAWTKFAARVQAASAPMKQACAAVAGQPGPRTLPDRLHRMEQIETAQLERLRQITPAVEELYGSLTPTQRELADHLVGGMMHGPHPGMGPGMMPGRPAPDKTPG